MNIRKIGFGFTLIELLVVIAIMAILSTTGFAVYNNAQGRARDARRKADIDAIAKAYEAHYNPLSNKYRGLEDSDFVNNIHPKPPEDSTIDYDGYVPGFSQIQSSYIVCAKLEGRSSACTNPSDDKCYCKSSLQRK